jgi:CRP-like cAMP-binding protein
VNENNDNLTIPHLQFRRGDLILKQGDFGFSIYKILSGRVEVVRESDSREVPLAILGRGEIMGEVSFLSRGRGIHSASARALEDTKVEVWHPDLLVDEYEHMPPIIKFVADLCVRRLIRMDKLTAQVVSKRRQAKWTEPTEPQVSRRFYYRKQVELRCLYRPMGASPRAQRTGVIRDISLSGLQMEIRSSDVRNVDHKPGSMFTIKTVLPNGKELDLRGEVVSVRKDGGPGKISLGITFPDLNEESRKRLGFFLLPT